MDVPLLLTLQYRKGTCLSRFVTDLAYATARSTVCKTAGEIPSHACARRPPTVSIIPCVCMSKTCVCVSEDSLPPAAFLDFTSFQHPYMFCYRFDISKPLRGAQRTLVHRFQPGINHKEKTDLPVESRPENRAHSTRSRFSSQFKCVHFRLLRTRTHTNTHTLYACLTSI